MKNVLTAWLANKPLENPNSPADPLTMPEYTEKVVPVYYAEVVKLGEEAELKTEEAQQAKQTSSEYVFITVLLSSALFLAGIVSKLEKRRVRIALLAVAYVIALATLGLLLTLPISSTKKHPLCLHMSTSIPRLFPDLRLSLLLPSKTRGSGFHKNELQFYELALRDAGIEKLNLVSV